MNHFKKLWGHYLTLMILIIILAFPAFWIYRFFQSFLGKEAALFSLTVTVIVMMSFGIWGAVYTHRVVSILRRKIDHLNHPVQQARTKTPIVLKIFKIEQRYIQNPLAETKGQCEKAIESPYLSFPRKRRGKQPRFPEEKIRKAVLKWESRDPSFSVRTLEEFLAQEFGSSPDGILLMATTTFYDWRRRILKELESQELKS